MTDLCGFLLLDKATGISSNVALQQVRRLYQRAKAGHSGSLDPLASGMLPIFFGQATRFTRFLLEAPKTYRVTAQLGLTTSTGDTEGVALKQRPVPVLSQAAILSCLAAVEGEHWQIPPMYSALKVAGKPLYAYARKGIELERSPRKINVSKCTLIQFSETQISFEVTCSKGTYIRSLVETIGENLGCGAHVIYLRRLSVAGFTSEQLCCFEQLQALTEPERVQAVLPVASLVTHLPSWNLNQAQWQNLRHGRPLEFIPADLEWVRIQKEDGTFLGVLQLKNGAVRDRCLLTNAFGVHARV